jgi:hypothetical protein
VSGNDGAVEEELLFFARGLVTKAAEGFVLLF